MPRCNALLALTLLQLSGAVWKAGWSTNASDLYFGSVWFLSRGQDTDYPDRFLCVFFLVCLPTKMFYVLFVCKCVLYYCHQVATQLLLTNIISHMLIQYLQLYYYHILCTSLFLLFLLHALHFSFYFRVQSLFLPCWSFCPQHYEFPGHVSLIHIFFNLLVVEYFFQNDYCNSCWLTVLNSCTVTLNIIVWHILHNILRAESTSIFT